jgi:hypothetical protein
MRGLKRGENKEPNKGENKEPNKEDDGIPESRGAGNAALRPRQVARVG